MDSERIHNEKQCQAGLDGRLATIEGHIKAIRRMIQENKDCAQIITQILAVEKSIKSAGIELLKNHLRECTHDAREGNLDELEEFSCLLELFLK